MVVVTQVWTCVKTYRTVHQKEKISHEKALKLIIVWLYDNMLNYSPLMNVICFQSLTIAYHVSVKNLLNVFKHGVVSLNRYRKWEEWTPNRP